MLWMIHHGWRRGAGMGLAVWLTFGVLWGVPSELQAQGEQKPSATGLIAHWPMDSVTDMIPDQIGGFDLTPIQVNSQNLVPGRRGRAMELNGVDEYAARVETGELEGPTRVYREGTWSLTLWVKGDSRGQADKRLLALGSTRRHNPLVTLGTDHLGQGRGVDVYIRDDAGNVRVNHRQSQRAVFDGQWHHVAWVDARGGARLYIDGVLDRTDLSYSWNPLELDAFALGAVRRAETCCYFEGAIDEVSLWKTALSSDQVKALAGGIPVTDLKPAAPVILKAPEGGSVRTGEDPDGAVTLSVGTVGSQPLTYQWFKDGNPIPGATEADLSFSQVEPDVSGRYHVRVSNPWGETISSAAELEVTQPYYRLETIPVPDEIVLEVGGMEFMEDGRLMICTRRGEIWSLKEGTWRRFASGLDEPMGICVTGPDELVVAQRPELTRITDTDRDGVADEYETITNAWGYSGHMYEWAFGPVQDQEGNLWGALAYWFFPGEQFLQPPYDEGTLPGLLRLGNIKPPAWFEPQPTQYRGWSFKVTPEGKFVPWSTGLRSPNGLGVNPDGDVFVTDNQGEYVGTSPLHHISQGAFHGYPAGLLWDDRVEGDPTTVPMERLRELRKPPAIRFPYGDMGQSISQPLWDKTGGKFGPFAGQMFIGDQTKSTVMRACLEKVEGEYQGACFPFQDGFASGVNRLAFAPDGSLYAGQTDRGWGAVGGQSYALQRLVWTGREPLEIHTMSLLSDGFELSFTRPVDPASAADPDQYSLQHYDYLYHRSYGSPQVNTTPVEVESVEISADQQRLILRLPELVAGRIYELHIEGVQAVDGRPLLHSRAYYTLNRLRREPGD